MSKFLLPLFSSFSCEWAKSEGVYHAAISQGMLGLEAFLVLPCTPWDALSSLFSLCPGGGDLTMLHTVFTFLIVIPVLCAHQCSPSPPGRKGSCCMLSLPGLSTLLHLRLPWIPLARYLTSHSVPWHPAGGEFLSLVIPPVYTSENRTIPSIFPQTYMGFYHLLPPTTTPLGLSREEEPWTLLRDPGSTLSFLLKLFTAQWEPILWIINA